MCVNDIACIDLYFHDYIACGKSYPEDRIYRDGGVAEGYHVI